LLLALAQRWGTLPHRSRVQIEARVLAGPRQWPHEDEHEYEERRAWETLQRLQWLIDKGCGFSSDLGQELEKLRRLAPAWRPEYAKRTADSRETRGGWVHTNTEYAVLLREPIDSLLLKASQLSGRDADNAFDQRDPFAGLCAERPMRAYRVLLHSARRNQFPEWAWTKFLTSAERENDSARLSSAIALRLSRCPVASLQHFLHSSTWWLEKCSKALSKAHPIALDKVTAQFMKVVQLEVSEPRSEIRNLGRDRDWVTDALNSPAGQIAVAIFKDSRFENIKGDGDLATKWLSKLESLLDLTEDSRRQAIAIMSHSLGWLHDLAPSWAELHLLSIIEADDADDQSAFWAGFLSNPQITSDDFYLRLKPALLARAKKIDSANDWYVQSLAYLILWGWVTTRADGQERLVSGDECRDVLLYGRDELRSQTIWQFERALANADSSGFARWASDSQEFFRHVWPRQRSVKNSTMSRALVELLVSNVGVFSTLAEIVLPLLTKIDHADGLYFGDRVHAIVDQQPSVFLDVLQAVLPDEAST
jgi:hypothetical protein